MKKIFFQLTALLCILLVVGGCSKDAKKLESYLIELYGEDGFLKSPDDEYYYIFRSSADLAKNNPREYSATLIPLDTKVQLYDGPLYSCCTDKSEYEVGDIITVTAANNDSHDISYTMYGMWQIEFYCKDKWYLVKPVVSWPAAELTLPGKSARNYELDTSAIDMPVIIELDNETGTYNVAEEPHKMTFLEGRYRIYQEARSRSGDIIYIGAEFEIIK